MTRYLYDLDFMLENIDPPRAAAAEMEQLYLQGAFYIQHDALHRMTSKLPKGEISVSVHVSKFPIAT